MVFPFRGHCRYAVSHCCSTVGGIALIKVLTDDVPVTHCIGVQTERSCACFLPKTCVRGSLLCSVVHGFLSFMLKGAAAQGFSLHLPLLMFYFSLCKPLAGGENFLCDFTETNPPHQLSFGGALSTYQLIAKNIYILEVLQGLFLFLVSVAKDIFFHLNFILMSKIVIYSVSINLDSLASFLIQRFHNPFCLWIRYCM